MEFELDRDRYELRRSGRAVKLERMPMELLILLVAKKGHLVTRLEIIECLWGNEVFIDSEHGINTAVRKLRQALRDDPEKPRFVETVTGKGYRFVAQATEVDEAAAAAEVPKIVRARNGRSPEPAVVVTGIEEAEPDNIVQAAPVLPAQESSRHRSLVLVAVGSLVALGLIAIAISWVRFDWSERFFNRSAQLKIESLAVIPLENFSGDPGQDYFADGMTDELITMLAKNSTLRIISRTSVMQYKGVHRPVRDIAKELGVDGILEGSVARSGNTVHMTLQLIHAPTDTHIWADSYDRDRETEVSLPLDAARTIAARLKKLSGLAGPRIQVNPEAHDAYLRGMYLWDVGDTEGSGGYFKKAVALQPDYALGWSGLSNYYGQKGMQEGPDQQASFAQGESAAIKALQLDDSLAEAHYARAGMYWVFSWNWAQADMESARAVELSPDLAEAHHVRSYVLTVLNRMDEALAEQKRSTDLDQFTQPWGLARALIRQHQFDAAAEDLQMRLHVNPNDGDLYEMLAQAYRCKGMEKEAAQALQKQQLATGREAFAAAMKHAFEHGGYKAVLELQLNDLKTQAAKKYVPPLQFAFIYARLGRKEETLQFLEQAYRAHSPHLTFVQHEPDFDFLHSDDRYRAIVRQVGLPPAY
ncbi:MAG: winged helix-turn-helix domain-containing protein [Terracidiphilus sp.]|nr:winged helix-turn-helix domain-containing protein [Terracidiphilus sp.]